MKVKISVVQPLGFLSQDGEMGNLERAPSYIDTAAKEGAKIICFPEGYPGPFFGWNKEPYSGKQRKTWNWLDVVSRKAKEHGVYVIGGGLEDIDGSKYYNYLLLIGPDGKVVGRYNRTTPIGPYLSDFDYEVGKDLPVFETSYGKIGLLTCSEVYLPELSRVLALKGAEMIFLPSGGLIMELTPTWKTLIWARAIENLAYTATCERLFGVEDGIAMIASPEAVLGEKTDEGVLTAEIDLSRIRWLREQKESLNLPKPYKVVPGTLKWRRPKLYRDSYPDW